MCRASKYCDSAPAFSALIVFLGLTATAACAFSEVIGHRVITTNHWRTWAIVFFTSMAALYVLLEAFYISYSVHKNRGTHAYAPQHFIVYTRFIRVTFWGTLLWFLAHVLFSTMNDTDMIDSGISDTRTNAAKDLVYWIVTNMLIVIVWIASIGPMSDVSYRAAAPLKAMYTRLQKDDETSSDI